MSTSATIGIQDLEVFADQLDPKRAAEIYKEHGALVVRGLMKKYVPQIHADIEACAREAIGALDEARKVPEGWVTPDGTLWLPAPAGFSRDKQIMVLSCSYTNSATFFQSAFDKTTLDILEAIIGPDIELFMNGQCLYKEPVGGHAKNLHQDAAYFEHRYEGPCAILSYVVDTDLQNGALHVMPGTHRQGMIDHINTSSHLGLDEKQWPWERALPIIGEAGDSIFFHVKTVHGSKSNTSKAPRPVFIHRYRAPNDYIVIKGSMPENRKALEDARKENQMGFMVRGRRKYDAKRAEAI